MSVNDVIITKNDLILVTGSSGFIGSRVVKVLLDYGFTNLRCFVRPTSNITALSKLKQEAKSGTIEIIKGNLQSPQDCYKATKDVTIIYHLAASSEKSYSGCFMNTVIPTKQLLESCVHNTKLKRFVNVSSFAVYSNKKIRPGGLLDERCPIESDPLTRNSAYCFAKIKQEELVYEYNKKYNIPFVILRPGAVFGPGNASITARVGIDTFGIFFHLGGSNQIPLTYVDNCADAIVLAGIKKGIDGEVFNIVDDNLPTSKTFLKLYKNNVKRFASIYIPYTIFYFFCYLWELYSRWSKGQLPPVFNRNRCATIWKSNTYSNDKMKKFLGWKVKIPMDEGLKRYFEYCKLANSK